MKTKILFVLLNGFLVQASENSAPKWDYGIGFGGVHFEQYPAAGKYTQLALPVPTFKYRGEILYADDRDGAQLFLFKSETFKIEFSGFGYPPLESKENSNRKDMKDLPLLVALGPQMLYKPTTWLELVLGYYESLSLTAENQKTSGFAYQTRAIFSHEFESELFKNTKFLNRLFLTARYGSKKLQSLYYDIGIQDATAQRPAFKSREGLLSQEVGYLLQTETGRWNSYVGFALTDYSQSRNKKSPLFESERAFTFFVGINYILRESKD